jgi:hypothetical protein
MKDGRMSWLGIINLYEILTMKNTKKAILLIISVSLTAFILTSCGSSYPDAGSIVITPATSQIEHGQTVQFTAKGKMVDGTEQDITSLVAWTSTNSDIIIDSNGLATEATTTSNNTTATITATTSGVTATAKLSVLTSISVAPTTASIYIGATKQFAATGTYSDGSTKDISSIATWTSESYGTTYAYYQSNGAAAKATVVKATGLATAVSSGTAYITATSGSISGYATLTIAYLSSIAVTPASKYIPPGSTQQYVATGTYSDKSTLDITKSVTWTSESYGAAAIATVVEATGLATAVSSGTAYITATSGSVSGYTDLTVMSVSSLAVTPATPSITIGSTQQFIATITYSDHITTAVVTTSSTWSSETSSSAAGTNGASGKATVGSATGLATGVSVGTAYITAKYSGITGNTGLTVGNNLTTINLAADITTLTFTTGGTYTSEQWFGQKDTSYDGFDAVQSGPIVYGGDTTWLQTTIPAGATTQIKFYWKLSDTVNDTLKVYVNGTDMAMSVSTTWQQVGPAVTAGSIVKWVYTKGSSSSSTADAWVDQVTLSP